ncbi:MAG: phosphopyruvate hydratase [Candidatus Kerfeldbacteria bacterium]|nr:phosphopyruvate hydratase [Candidatus Kerfeldbacteria bacterium]
MTTPRLRSLHAREILDSRGNPTVEVTALLSDDTTATAAVPSGASTGQFEALELRDGDPVRYNGKGVLAACATVQSEILPKLRGMKVTDQRELDERLIELDGTPNKARLGANAMLGVSLACARAAGIALGLPLYRSLRKVFDLADEEVRLPDPMLNIVNGGRHADNGLDFQEYMIIPHGRTFAHRLRVGVEITAELAGVIRMRGLSTLVGDEGGFAPHLTSNRDALELIVQAIDRTNYRLGKDVHLALDTAASEFYLEADHTYFLRQDRRRLTTDELIGYYTELVQAFPLASIEDGLADVDETGWHHLTRLLRGKILLVGDDLFATNPHRFERGIQTGLGNAIIIKPNQIGTLTETIDTVRLAQTHSYTPIISHRSGETSDSFIADLAVAVGSPLLKAGAAARGERLAKYNRLLAIEDELQ